MFLVGVSYLGRNTFRGFSILRESARNGATIFETLRAATPCERMAAAQPLGVFAVLIVAGPWLLSLIIDFTRTLFQNIPFLVS